MLLAVKYHLPEGDATPVSRRKSRALTSARSKTTLQSPDRSRLRRSGPHPDLWVAPRTTLSAPPDDASWSIHPNRPTDARLLELADIALGVRKPHAFRRRRSLFLAEQRGR